jgi:hypothetical protein
MERHENDDFDAYQPKIGGHQGFTVCNGAGLAELRICDVELMEEEEPDPLKTRLHKSQWVIERKQRLDVCVAEANSDVVDF